MISQVLSPRSLELWQRAADSVGEPERRYASQQVAAAHGSNDEIVHRWIAQANDTVVGFSSLRMPSASSSIAKFYCNVTPSHRRRGTGRAIVRELIWFVRQNYPLLSSIRVDSECSSSASFLKAVGCECLRSTVGLTTSLSTLTGNSSALPTGTAGKQVSAEELRRVAESSRDPSMDDLGCQLDVEVKDMTDTHRVSYVAFDCSSGRPIGLSTARLLDATNARQDLTWIWAQWRRRGIATALKTLVAKSIADSADREWCVMRTECESTNAAAIGLNMSLGFRPTGARRSLWVIAVDDHEDVAGP